MLTREIDLFDTAPPWFRWALHEVGTKELPGNTGPAIRRYIALGKCGKERDAWCAIFVNAALESCGIPGTRSPSSQSFRTSKHFVRLEGPALGAVAVFWRVTRGSGLGHVGLFRGGLEDHVWILGGNEGDQVQVEPLPVAGESMGLIGYWWPASVPLPVIGPVLMPAPVSGNGKVT